MIHLWQLEVKCFVKRCMSWFILWSATGRVYVLFDFDFWQVPVDVYVSETYSYTQISSVFIIVGREKNNL